MSLGELSWCAQRRDGTAACWGRGRLAKSDPAAGAFTAISASNDYACGLRPDATVECWGHSWHLLLDPPPGGAFTAVAAGLRHSWALRDDHTVTCWGEVATDLRGNNDT